MDIIDNRNERFIFKGICIRDDEWLKAEANGQKEDQFSTEFSKSFTDMFYHNSKKSKKERFFHGKFELF